jgi:glycosyltransferase involved in cell wall biosynthesis
MALSVVHVIERLRPGGPIQALIGAAREDAAGACRHRVISLLSADAGAVARAAEAGIQVLSAPPPAELELLLSAADIVQAHFWNNPALHAWLGSGLPAMRLIVWCHVNGLHPPQSLPGTLFERADLVAATSAASLHLPAFRAAAPHRRAMLFAGADFSRLDGLRRQEHDGFNVGYIGVLDFVKLHPDFIQLCAMVRDRVVHFHVCGDGADRVRLERQAVAAGLHARMHFYGHMDDIRPILARCDVFGYPLCPDTYCTAELALQEAMYAGLPPVVFPYGGLDRLVRHGHDGWVVSSKGEYVRALDILSTDPVLVHRLRTNAIAGARTRFGRARTLREATGVYERLMDQPKRARPPVATQSGAEALLASLDGMGTHDLKASRDENASIAMAAESRIAQAGPNWRQVILQYRFHYPADPHLHLWAALLLRVAGRPGLAAAEFKACLDLGLDQPRIRYYYRAARQAAA